VNQKLVRVKGGKWKGGWGIKKGKKEGKKLRVNPWGQKKNIKKNRPQRGGGGGFRGELKSV